MDEFSTLMEGGNGWRDAINLTRSCQILFFGDQSIPFEHTLCNLLHLKDDPILSAFFEKVAFHMRRYLGSLPIQQQSWFPPLTTLLDVVSQHEAFEGAPAIKFALLCATQLGQFIRYLGRGSNQYPSAASTYLVGACTGSFAAAAISTSKTVSELLPAAVEAVLVALRCALCAFKFREDIEAGAAKRKPWTALLGVQRSEADILIKGFNENIFPLSARLYISSVNRSSVSISGPPRFLTEFVSSKSMKHSFLPIELPYHAPHIFSSAEVDTVVGDFHDPGLEEYAQRFNIVSAASGSIISTLSFKQLIQGAVSEALTESLNWDLMTESLGEELSRRQTASCTVYQVSSQTGPLLSSALTANLAIDVNVLDILPGEVETDSSASQTGKFSHSSIAIIGYSGRFPESASNEEFWELLMAGRDVHREIPEDRFDWRAHYDPTGKKKNTSRIKYGCFIKDPGLFDARFFNMSPRECESCDPAQRLAITSAYDAIEMAGLVPNTSPSTQADRIGVFYGVTSDDWREVNSGQNIDTYFIPGGNRAFIPGRISYFFRFCGPSLSIDTACSSSFAAIQTACGYLWRGECDTALAGGANILTNPDNFAGLDRGHFLSSTGNCNAFDDGANGYCRSDAVGTVILKRLEDAITDNDPIQGVIRGAYTNHCGRADSITRPFEGDQAAVFNRIMRYSGVDPNEVGYVEMHGTGTQAGDATEMKSVLSVFAPDAKRNIPLYLGTAKANIGHAESASGVSSLIKVLMMMKNKMIPPHCGIKTKINQGYPKDMEERNIHIPFVPTPWHAGDSKEEKRKAFLNNFSAAGGNTAMLVEEPPQRLKPPVIIDARSKQLVTVSAKTAKSLAGNVEALVGYLNENPGVSLSSLSYTTTARRIHQSYRIAVSGSDIASIQARLEDLLPTLLERKPIPPSTNRPPLILAFTGQGTVYNGLGKQLMKSVPCFQDRMLRFNRIAEQQGFPSFLPLINGTMENWEQAPPVVTQLALVCVQMALHDFWRSLGVTPAALIGHSLGEYPALFASGVLSAADVVYLVGTRAQLLSQTTTAGTHAMLAVRLPASVIKSELEGTPCEIACFNQPSSNVVSGPVKDLEALEHKLKARGAECILLDIPYAFHSSQVDPLLEGFQKSTSNVSFRPPLIPYVSSSLGKVVAIGDTDTLTGSYLVKSCRNPVKFQGAIEAARSDGLVSEKCLWVEVGSHPACSGMIKGILGPNTLIISSLNKNKDSWAVLASELEILYASGIDICWTEYHRGFEQFHEVLSLPRYSWDLKKYWIPYRNNFCLTKGDDPVIANPESATEQQVRLRYLSPSVQRIIEQNDDAQNSTIIADSDIHDERLAPILAGHSVNGTLLCPSSLYADIALTIAEHLTKAVEMDIEKAGFDVADMKVTNPLILQTDKQSQIFRVTASADWAKNNVSFSLFSVNDQGKKTKDHATFAVHIGRTQRWLEEWKRNSFLVYSRVRALYESAENGDAHRIKRRLAYQLFSTIVEYSADYQGMQEVILDSEQHEATAKVAFHTGENGFTFNPTWVDSLGHIAGFIMNASDATPSKAQVFINHGWERMRCAVKFSQDKQYQVYNRMHLESGTTYVGDTYIFEDANLVAVFEGIRFQGIPRAVLDRLLFSKGQSNPVSNNKSVKAVDPLPPRPTIGPINITKIPSTDSLPIAISKAATGGIGSRVMDIISQEVGVSPHELVPTEDFRDHGIDSLLSLTIVGRIQEELGVELSSSLFIDYPTPKDLMVFFKNVDDSSSSSSETGSGITMSGNADSGCDTEATSDQGLEPSVLDIIRETIAEETGIGMDELTMSTSLSDIGVDSLLALTIVGRLSEVLEIDLPSTLFLDAHNLEEIGGILGLGIPVKSQQMSPAVPPTHSFDAYSGPRSTSILLWGNAKTAKSIIFLFPDGSGSATSYATVPKIGADTAAYALNCPWMKTPHEMTCTLEELTSKYLVEIRRRQAVGPYILGGWSAGGICAYEAAQQLAREGQTTARLILIDSPNPIGLDNPPQRMYDFFESINIFGTSDHTVPSWLRPHFDAFIRLLDNYEIKPFHNNSGLRTHILYARDGICKYPDDPRPETRLDDPREMTWLLNNRTDFTGDGWASLVGRQNLHVEILDEVNHFSMMDKGPHMEIFGNFLRRSVAQFV